MPRADVIVAGAGVGGICAALAAARTGAEVLLLEREAEIGGTGVHSPVALVCKFHASDHRPINLGIHRELFPETYLHSTRDKRPTAPRLTYDEAVLRRRYRELIAAERRLSVRTRAAVTSAEVEGRRLVAVTTASGERLAAAAFVDGTADGDLAALAGCRFELGRESDGAMQTATLVFGMSGVDKARLRVPEYATRGGLDSLWAELKPLFVEARARGMTRNPRPSVLVFPYPDGDRLLFNSTAVTGVDPTRPGNVEAKRAEAEGQVHELVAILRLHPAFAGARLDFVAGKLGVREGRRIVGDYRLTEEDCLGEARFDDMVAACAYEIDIHDPAGGGARQVEIPGSGYYHVPYRALVAADLDNLLLGSRCISGSHEAHSSYRVMSCVSAIGQAAGTAAALAALEAGGSARSVPAWRLRRELRSQVQFVEGAVEPPC